MTSTMDENESLNQHHMAQELEVSFSQQQQQSKPKTKSRGNRKLQRYRRKLRNQGMDSSKPDQITQNNGVKPESTANETIFHPPKPINKKKHKKKLNIINEQEAISKKKKNNSSGLTSTRKIKPQTIINDSIDYASVPDEVFLQMLSTTFSDSEKLNSLLNEDDRMKFIRHYTSLIDRICYLQLQDFQWKYYHHIGTTQNIWKGRMAKRSAEKYSIHHTYGRSKAIIEQRLIQIEKNLQKAYCTVYQFEKDIMIKLAQYDNYSYTIRELSSIIHQFIQEKQQPMQHEFEYQREMLILDATDHQLIRTFFDIEPNKSQKISARRIWQATMKQMLIEEDIALLEYRRLTSTQLQSLTSNLIGCMIDDIDTNLKNSNETIEISSTNLSLSNEINRLQALKKDIIHQCILTSRRMIENWNKTIQIEQNRFSLQNRFIKSTLQWQKMVLDAIETRRLHMIERANFIKKYKLTT